MPVEDRDGFRQQILSVAPDEFGELLLNEKFHRFVGFSSPEEHGIEDRDLFIQVIVHDHAALGGMLTQSPADILDKLPAKGDGEGQKQRVNLRTVEPFSQVLTGGDDEKFAFHRLILDLLHDGRVLFLSDIATQQIRGFPFLLQTISQ